MWKVFAASASMMLLMGQTVFAQQLIVDSEHSYFQDQMATRDAACQTAALEALDAHFEGIESLTIKHANFWNSVVTDVENYAFPKSIVTSPQGEVEAQINCLVYAKTNVVIEISFQFQPGLKGTKRGAASEYGTGSYVSQKTVQITGAN